MKRFLVLAFVLFYAFEGIGQSVGDFQTRQDGDWTNSDTWEEVVSIGPVVWSNTANTPTSADGIITLGHNVTIQSPNSITVDQVEYVNDFSGITGFLIVGSGATMIVSNGTGDDIRIINDFTNIGFLQVDGNLVLNSNATIVEDDYGNFGIGPVPATSNVLQFSTGSNCTINAGNTVPGFLSVGFYDLVWNGSSQSALIDFNGALTNISNDFTINSTNGNILRFSNSTSYTMQIGNNLQINGNSRVFFVGSATCTINITGDFNIASTSVTPNAITSNVGASSTFNIGGNFSKTNNATFNLGPGPSSGSTFNFSGDFIFSGGTITRNASGATNMNFDGTGNVDLTNTLNGSASFNYTFEGGSDYNILNGGLTGNGTFTLEAGANLGVISASGIVSGVGSGPIRVLGTRTYSIGSTIEYIGIASQSLGDGFPSSAVNFNINNANGVILNSDRTIGGNLIFTNGDLNISAGRTLTLEGTISGSGGVISTVSTSNLTIGGTGTLGTLNLGGTNSFNNFTLNRTSSGSVSLGNDLTVSGNLTQTAGNLILNGNELTIANSYTQAGGSIVSNASSSINVTGSGTLPSSLSVSGNIQRITLDRASSTLNIGASSVTAETLELFSGTLSGTGITISNLGTIEKRENSVLSNAPAAAGTYNLIYNISSGTNSGPELTTNLANLTKQGSGILTAQNDFTVNGDVTLSNGSFDFGSNTVSLNGDFVANAGSTLTSATITFDGITSLSGSQTPTFGSITVNGTFNPTSSLNVNGDITNNGTLNSSAGTLTFNAASQLGGSSPITVNNLTIGASGNVTASATQPLTLNGNLTNNGSFAANGGTVIFGGNTTITGTVPTFANVTVGVGGIFTSPSSLTVAGNFTNNGTFNNSAGTLNLTGTGSRNISGTAALPLHLLNVSGGTVTNSNTGGVTIADGLTLGANTIFNVGNGTTNEVTLLSTSSTDAAYVGQIPSTSSVTGNITVQRFFSTGRFWRYLGSPVTNATVADWQEEFPITGTFSDPSTGSFDGTTLNSSFPTLYYYNAGGSAYIAYPTSGTAASNPIENGRGYSPFIRNNISNIIGAVTGTLKQQSASMPVAYNGDPNESWNLVANPYAAPIDWDAVGWTKTNVLNEVHIPLVSSGSFATYIGGVSANGGSRYIASGQAFWVRTNAASPALTAVEAVKSVSENPTYFRTEPLEVFRIKMLHAGLSDEIVFALRDEATFGYDEAFDANRRLNINGFGYTLSTTGDDDRKLKINSIPKVVDSDCSITIPINMESVTKTGDFTLAFTEINTLLQYYDIDFIDNYKNEVISLDGDFQYNYVINADAGSKSTTRFSLQLNNTDISPLSGLENIDACASAELTYSLDNLNQHYIYSVYKGEELLTELSNQTDASVAIPDTFVQNALNEFDVYARAGTCDSVSVGAFAISIADNTINLNVGVIGSNICPAATSGNFELNTEEGVKYSIINGTDTIQNIVGDGTIFTGIIESNYLNAGVNSFNVYAKKNECTYGTLAQSIVISVDDVEIDESIAFTSSNTCFKSPTDIIFTSQSGVDYQIFKGTSLVNTITGDGSEQTVEITEANLSPGTNEFTIMAQYGQCAEFEFPEPIQIEVEENINTNLSLITENICGDANTSVLIENAQAGKVYTLQSATGNISSLTAQADGELVFNLNRNQLNIGLNEFDIQIEGEYCGQVASTNSAQITMFEPINTNLAYTTNSSCSRAEVIVGIQNTQAGKTYYLYKGETLIETLAATEAGSVVFESANNALDIGGNEFRLEIEGEGCGIEPALQNINVNLFEGINSALEITSNDVCNGQDVVIEIANPQINKTYFLKTSEGVLASRLAESTGALSFVISSEQFSVGNQDIFVEISDDNCGTVEANSISFTLYESINSNLSYLSANSCSANEAIVGIQNAQAGKIYKLYKGGSLVESITATADGELIFANANHELLAGLNTFNLTIEGEACGAVDVGQNLSITLYEAINPDLDVNSSNVCSGDQVNIEITNPQAGKTYRLMASENVLATETAPNEDVLIFSLPSSNFGIGYHVLNIDIVDDNCGTITANQTVEFELFDAAVITEIEDQNVCKGESVTIDLSANLTMSSYQLYLGEELVSEVSTETLNLSPTETTTYTLTGIPENGCSVNTVNFTIEVSELATPGILVSANVLESSVEGDSYQWYLNKEILEGEIGKILVAQASGDYKVEVSKANCLKISDTYTFSEEVLNANKALADAVHLYPNPVVDVLRIDMENIGKMEVKIYTLSGRFMDKINLNSNSEQAIDMSKFAEGTYLIQMTAGKGSITKRIIKK